MSSNYVKANKLDIMRIILKPDESTVPHFGWNNLTSFLHGVVPN